MEEQNITSEKLTDKAFIRLLTLSISKIVLCMICLCLTTYAWFTASGLGVGAAVNTAEKCALEVFVSSLSDDGQYIEGISSGIFLEEGEYRVELRLPANAPSGYCIVEAGGHVYFSDCIIGDGTGEAQTTSFVLRLEIPLVVSVTTRHGIYTRSGDVLGGVLVIKNIKNYQ